MAGTSGCSREGKEMKSSDTWCTMGGSDESEYLTASASEADPATTSSSFVSAVEEQIEHSKAHWSTLVDQSGCSDEDEEVAEVSNVEEFKALQTHPIWGGFFRTFGYDFGIFKSDGELVMGNKFAEGGQAELYEAQVKWEHPKNNEVSVKEGTEYVLKVFKKGTFLKHLKSQLPKGYLQFCAWEQENWGSPSPKVYARYYCNVFRGTLLKDGRFAFLMEKEHADLRSLIQLNMELRSGEFCGPFIKEEAENVMYDVAEYIMYNVALGVHWLHSQGIVHRDLKASNVLVREEKGFLPSCYIADYECSIGVVGTGFFRAPEILQACRDRNVNQRPEVFSRAADVYGYGMTCYEILTGKLPFEDHPLSDNHSLLTDLVIDQHLRPQLPKYVEGWKHDLLNRCWQSNPQARPTFGEILNFLSTHSAIAKIREDKLKDKYGENFRSW